MTVSYKNNLDEYKKFLYYTALFEERKIRSILVYAILTVGLLIASIVMICCRIFNAGALFLYLVIGLSALTLWQIGKIIVVVKRSIKRMPTVAPDFLHIVNSYEFKEDGLTVSSKNNVRKKTQVTELEYSAILKGRERKDIVYLYLYPNVAFMFKKSEFDGDVNELIALLKNKLGDKFLCRSK